MTEEIIWRADYMGVQEWRIAKTTPKRIIVAQMSSPRWQRHLDRKALDRDGGVFNGDSFFTKDRTRAEAMMKHNPYEGVFRDGWTCTARSGLAE
jgi:hypothetical protein